MARNKLGKKSVVAAALALCFITSQSVLTEVSASQITGITGVQGPDGNFTYNIDPSAAAGDIGFRKYTNFNLSEGDIANLIFQFKNEHGNLDDISAFVNFVDNQININGIVNTMRGNNFYNGKAVFVSPNGMVVGASGVLNVGSLSILTPTQESYDVFKGNVKYDPLLLKDLSSLYTKGDGVVKIDGKIAANDGIEIHAADVAINNGANLIAGVRKNEVLTSADRAKVLFDNLVNTDNLTQGGTQFTNTHGSIQITSFSEGDAGVVVNGTMKNFGAEGDTLIASNGTKGTVVGGVISNTNGKTTITNQKNGVNISGKILNQGGTLSITNKGENGLNTENTAVISSNKDVEIDNLNGINHKGIMKGHAVKINNTGGNIVIGDAATENNIQSATDLVINLENGSILNAGVNKNLISTGGNLNLNVKNGTIGTDLGVCDGTNCTGIKPESRDFTKSINVNVDGTVTAKTVDENNTGDNFVINIASKEKDMKVDSIKADGRVILTAGSNETPDNRFSIFNAASNPAVANIEGKGISLIASNNIGAKDNKLTFNQTDAENYGMDLLAINNIYIKGLDDSSVLTNICSMIAREGSIDAEFSGNVNIRETTAAKELNIVTRGAEIFIENIGSVPYTPVDYFGENGLIVPETIKVTALDINPNTRVAPVEIIDGGYKAWADSKITIVNGRVQGSKDPNVKDVTLTADNVFAHGKHISLGKDGFSVVDDNTTNLITKTGEGEFTMIAKAVKPEDVIGIGRDEKERNYYEYNEIIIPGDDDDDNPPPPPPGDDDDDNPPPPPPGDDDDDNPPPPPPGDDDDDNPPPPPPGDDDDDNPPPPPPGDDDDDNPPPPPPGDDDVTNNDPLRLTYKKYLDNEEKLANIDKRQYMRFDIDGNKNPVQLISAGEPVQKLVDISRGGIAVKHNKQIKVGDVMPVHIAYGDLDIAADVKVVTANDNRAGAMFVNLDKATANKLLYMNILMEEANKTISLK